MIVTESMYYPNEGMKGEYKGQMNVSIGCDAKAKCNSEGGYYQNGDSSKWRQMWAWGCKGECQGEYTRERGCQKRK